MVDIDIVIGHGRMGKMAFSNYCRSAPDTRRVYYNNNIVYVRSDKRKVKPDYPTRIYHTTYSILGGKN